MVYTRKKAQKQRKQQKSRPQRKKRYSMTSYRVMGFAYGYAGKEARIKGRKEVARTYKWEKKRSIKSGSKLWDW